MFKGRYEIGHYAGVYRPFKKIERGLSLQDVFERMRELEERPAGHTVSSSTGKKADECKVELHLPDKEDTYWRHVQTQIKGSNNPDIAA